MSKPYTPRPYQGLATAHLLEHKRCALWAGMGLGKEQPVSEPVLTPSGWTPIGALRVGDLVIGASGVATEVTGVFPQGRKTVLRVTFSDGASTRAGLDHLWAVRTPKDKYTGRGYRVMSTADIMRKGLHDAYGNKKWGVPLVDPVEMPEADLPIEPYLLGVLLGDGCLRADGRAFLTTDEEIASRWPGHTVPHGSGGIVTKHLRGLGPALKALGLAGKRSWEKHVPEEYLWASASQRLALLQGLLDIDGHPMRDGGIEFCSTSENLVDSVRHLVWSLGGVARNKVSRATRHQGGEGRESWRINVKLPPDTSPFRLSRKARAYVPPTKYPPIRMITSVEVEDAEESVCISVAAEDHLYVTKDFIVTHNTVSTLTALEALKFSGEEDGPVLILAPKRVARRTWSDEAEKWDHLEGYRVVPIVGTKAERVAAVAKKADAYTINYENIEWLVESWGSNWPYRVIVADEADRLKSLRLSFRTATKKDGTPGKEYLAGQGGARARALGMIAHTPLVRRFIELTGTPAPNGLKDLWGQLWFLDAGKRLGRTYEAFMQRWFQKGYDGYSVVPTAWADRQIHEAVADICLSIRSEDYFDLEKPIVNNVYVDLPAKARKLYKDMEREMFLEIEDRTSEAFGAAARTQKCLQLANGAVYVDPLAMTDSDPRSKEWRAVHDEKIEALEDIIGEAGGAPVIVVYEFRSDLARLLKAFPKGRHLATDKDEQDFKAGRIPILFAHPKSAGHGIDGFQNVCNQIVFFGHNWSLGEYQQIIERIGPVRQMQAGLNRSVFIHHIIARDTVDELVMERRESKREVQDILLEAAKRR